MNDQNFPRISFGIIMLNNEPFVRYNLRALYPFAHQIIVVEGAVERASNIATEDGHSRDGTLETLRQFKAEEDPDDKLIIITRDGFWSEKDEMSQAYADVATGDYLWQVDGDEFYRAGDMQAVIDLLRADPSVSAVTFPTWTFWGSPDFITNGWYLRRGERMFHRLFKWGEGFRYVTHRPPTVTTGGGEDTRKLKWLNGEEMEKRGIYLYHYSLLFPKQVIDKCDYYSRADWAKITELRQWAQDNYLQLGDPFRVHNVIRYPSWLEHFEGKPHPQQVQQMWTDIQSGQVNIDTRPMDDVLAIIDTGEYQRKIQQLKREDYLNRINDRRWQLVKKLSNWKKRLTGNADSTQGS